jgi:hypothetical protein
MAAANKEAWAGGPEFSASTYGARLRTYPEEAIGTFMWPIAVDDEDDYEYALNNGHEHPGGADVINDAKLQAGVQAHWPRDPIPDEPFPIPMVQPTPGVPVTPT